jgi:predicted acetyltransferase
MEYEQWLSNTEKNSRPETVREDWVVATTYFVVRKDDNKIIGMIDIRHSINNVFLTKYGGHIGYAVRPSERKKGYATKMLTMALEYAKSIGLQKVMLGCYSNNIASIKTITKCGGVLTESKPCADGTPINVYWVDLS